MAPSTPVSSPCVHTSPAKVKPPVTPRSLSPVTPRSIGESKAVVLDGSVGTLGDPSLVPTVGPNGEPKFGYGKSKKNGGDRSPSRAPEYYRMNESESSGSRISIPRPLSLPPAGVHGADYS